MAKALQNFRQVWERTTLIQRVLLIGIALGCAGAVALLVGWARRPHMVMLYSDIAPDEAARIVEKIRDAGVKYELTNGGTMVNVPAEQVYSLRLTMASAGLPSGGEQGYRIIDKEPIGASPFAQRVNYKRAIEGELAKTIRLLEGVISARVHVVRPEAALFAEQKNNASATVVLQMKPGWRPTPQNVAAIINLVAGSVEGLTPEKVVVVDSRGKLLSGEAGGEFAKKAGTFLDYKSQVEDYLAGKVEDMLAVALGPNRASVRVDAVIDTGSIDETKEVYDPESKAVVKEELRTKIASAPAVGPAKSGGTEEDTVTDYLVSRTVSKKTSLPGEIKSLSVAAFVDLTPPKAEGEEAAPAATLTVKDVEGIIEKAIGLTDVAKTLKVVDTPFPKSAAAQAIEEMAKDAGGKLTDPSFLLEMARRFSLGILVIGALVLLRILRGPKRKASEVQAGALALQGQGTSAANLLPGMAGEPNAELLRAQISNALQENPEEVKRLFLSWIESDRSSDRV